MVVKLVNIIKSINASISLLIMIACVCFSGWKSIECVFKYLNYPKGTSLTIDHTTKYPFPAITICADPKIHKETVGFNLEKLKDCNINR